MSFRSVRSFLVLLLIAVLSYSAYQFVLPMYTEKTLEILPHQVRSQRFAYFIDVRTPQEREEYGFYPNSIPILIDQLDTQLTADIPNRELALLVYSSGDDRALHAAQKIHQLGYNHVRYLRGTYHDLMPGQLDAPHMTNEW